eukprot:gene24290-32726_t
MNISRVREEANDRRTDLIFSTLRRFPDVHQSFRASEDAGRTTQSSWKPNKSSSIRPSTAGVITNSYEAKNKKMLTFHNQAKISSIGRKMRQVVRDPVTNELNELYKIRREIAIDHKNSNQEYLKEFSHLMTHVMSPFESACIKLSRAGFLDFKALKIDNHGKLSRKLAIALLHNLQTDLFAVQENCFISAWSVEFLERQLQDNSVYLTELELKSLQSELQNVLPKTLVRRA